MKKWIVVPIALIAVALLAVYIFVPAKINLSQSITINCTPEAANRHLTNETNWYKWWPLTKSAPPSFESETKIFPYKNYTFIPQQRMFDAIRVNISTVNLTINSNIILIPKNKNLVSIQWNVNYYTANAPVARVKRYLQAGGLKQPISDILAAAKRFLEKTENVYGIAVKKAIVQDSLLLSTKKVFIAEPSTQDIYSLITKLKTHIQQQGAKETGYPMLNIQRKDSSHFETMVAIPVNKAVKEQNNMVLKNLVRGNILIADVTGGVQSVSHAFAQMETYLLDHHYQSPAIPFYSLITDRTAETDTTKWVTRINYPVL
jgi:effector-binding domain-containing protein